MKKTFKNIAKLIRTYRGKSSYSQRLLGMACGVNEKSARQWISGIECARWSVPNHRIYKMAVALNIPCSYIYEAIVQDSNNNRKGEN